MAPAFRALAGGRVRVQLTPEEAEVLHGLPGELKEVLEVASPEVMGRLFPPAYHDPEDIEREREYRGLMQGDLLRQKLSAVEVITEALARGEVRRGRWTVILSPEECTSWLHVLNDLRLTIGVRLGIRTEEDWQMAPGDPRAPHLALLHYLGWLEESLIEALRAAEGPPAS